MACFLKWIDSVCIWWESRYSKLIFHFPSYLYLVDPSFFWRLFYWIFLTYSMLWLTFYFFFCYIQNLCENNEKQSSENYCKIFYFVLCFAFHVYFILLYTTCNILYLIIIRIYLYPQSFLISQCHVHTVLKAWFSLKQRKLQNCFHIC